MFSKFEYECKTNTRSLLSEHKNLASECVFVLHFQKLNICVPEVKTNTLLEVEPSKEKKKIGSSISYFILFFKKKKN